jgi:hypothetical protein
VKIRVKENQNKPKYSNNYIQRINEIRNVEKRQDLEKENKDMSHGGERAALRFERM